MFSVQSPGKRRLPFATAEGFAGTSMDRLPVLCLDNNSPKYDGKVWLELLQDIVEHNGQAVSHPVSLSAFKEGDSVKVKQVSKKKSKLWNGRITYVKEDLLKPSETEQQPLATGRSVKRKKAKVTTESQVTRKRTKVGEC